MNNRDNIFDNRNNMNNHNNIRWSGGRGTLPALNTFDNEGFDKYDKIEGGESSTANNQGEGNYVNNGNHGEWGGDYSTSGFGNDKNNGNDQNDSQQQDPPNGNQCE